MNYSKYQLDIFKDVENGTGNTIINALAGSGKTSSIIASMNFVDPKLKSLMVAFNTKIAKELKEKAPAHVPCMTLHGIGLKYIAKAFPGIVVNEDKVSSILEKMFAKHKENFQLIPKLSYTISLAKGHLSSTAAEIDNLIDDFEIFFEEDLMSREDFINHVLFVLNFCKKDTNQIDLDDMIWFPNVIDISLPAYDRIFVDEAQDLNTAQRKFVLKMLKSKNNSGRCFVFGDRFQALYSWRGADSQSMQNFQNELNAKVLPLSITYRCPNLVVQQAKKLVPEFEASPTAKDGIFAWNTQDQMLKNAPLGSFIISRTRAPLIRIVLSFIKRNIPANIQGRNIADGLLAIIKKSKSKKIDKFLTYLDKWEKSETKRLLDKNKSPDVIKDKAECLRTLSEDCTTTAEVINKINQLFTNKTSNSIINCGTTHGMKGLESNVVYVLINTYNESSQEEKNCKYVAITRSKSELYYVVYKEDELI